MTREQWLVSRETIHDRFYEVLVGAVGCGPFDGGCVVVAQALQRVLGGEIRVLVRADDRADHAVLELDGRLWDFDGPDAPAVMVRRFNEAERAHCTGYRPIRPGDLVDAIRDVDLEEVLAAQFREILASAALAP